MIALTFLIYCFYIVVVFSYTANILSADKIKPIVYIILIAINCFIAFIPIYITDFYFEGVLMVLYLFAFTIESLIVCKKDLTKTLFGVFSFAINFFAIRTIIMVILAFISDTSIVDVIANEENRVLITSINLFIPIPYILLTRKVLKDNILNVALSDHSTAVLSTAFLGVTFINQIGMLPSLYTKSGGLQENLYYHLATAIFSIIIFILVMIINYIYSNLKVVADDYEEKLKELALQNSQIEDIEEMANKDSMTGFYVRDIAIKALEKYIKDKKECFIIFIDMDGLKTVNDNYGHNEGDWYIKAVAQAIQYFLGDYTISRFGGDEFIIVGKQSTHIDIHNIVVNLEKEILDIKKNYNKEYQTSISYGIQEVQKNTALSARDIIAVADNKMYDFKKERKRNRN